MINPHWLELPLSRTNSHGPKGVRAIEVRLYYKMFIGQLITLNKLVPELQYDRNVSTKSSMFVGTD